MFGHVVHADEVATVSAEGARCEVEGGLSMTKLKFFFGYCNSQWGARGGRMSFCWWEFVSTYCFHAVENVCYFYHDSIGL